jgi:peroxiredoxin
MIRNASAILGAILILASAALGAVAPGQPAPDFTLTDTAGHEHTLSQYTAKGHIVVIEWFNPDCPFIRKHHQHHTTMNDLYLAHAENGVVWLAINSGAEGKQGAGLERNRKAVEEYTMPFPVLLDTTGDVGRLYGAKTTPHMFVVAADGTVAYMGAIDDDRSADKLGGVNHVAEALAQLLAGDAVTTPATAPYGCSVKY